MSESQSAVVDVYKKANVGNIVKKLKSGKTLSTAERRALDDYEASQSGGEWAKDLSALAKELGLSRQAIYDARTRFPTEAPPRHADGKQENLEAWRKFCAEKLIGKDVATKTLAELKAELMREQIQLARSKNKRENSEVVDREVVRSMLRTLGQKWDLLLRLKLEVELGLRVAGKSAAEANVEGSRILDEIREVVNNNLARFEPDVIKQSKSSAGSAEAE